MNINLSSHLPSLFPSFSPSLYSFPLFFLFFLIRGSTWTSGMTTDLMLRGATLGHIYWRKPGLSIMEREREPSTASIRSIPKAVCAYML